LLQIIFAFFFKYLYRQCSKPNNEKIMEDSVIGGVSGAQLRQFIERIENLEQEKAELAEQIRDSMAEAKGEGFDVKTLRQLIRIRKMKKEDLAEQEELLDLYRRALGE
jgi:uncharacterized protein (UPF0335 family)